MSAIRLFDNKQIRSALDEEEWVMCLKMKTLRNGNKTIPDNLGQFGPYSWEWDKDGWIVIDQIRTIDKTLIIKVIDKLSTKEIDNVKSVIRETFVD